MKQRLFCHGAERAEADLFWWNTELEKLRLRCGTNVEPMAFRLWILQQDVRCSKGCPIGSMAEACADGLDDVALDLVVRPADRGAERND